MRAKQKYEELPDPSTPIWRYLDLAKFLALLHTRALYLCRADVFDDQFEGSFTGESVWAFQAFDQVNSDNFIAAMRWLPYRSFVSCWHADACESAALWKIYASSHGSLALQSTVGALQALFPDRADWEGDLLIYQRVKRVQYIDYRSEHPYVYDPVGPLCYKRRAFSYEQEIRAIRQELPISRAGKEPKERGKAIQVDLKELADAVYKAPSKERGKAIQVDLEKLVNAVYIAPSSPQWVRDVVEETMKRFGLTTVPCRQSTLDELPEFRGGKAY